MNSRIAVAALLATVIVATPALSAPGSGVVGRVLGRGCWKAPKG